jgi:membrane-associated phospholipid phosphatase
MRNSRNRWFSLVALSLGLSLAQDCKAESLNARALATDAGLYVTAPLRWDAQDWIYFTASALAVAAAHEVDGSVRDHFASSSSAAPAGQDPNSTRDALPAAAMVGLTLAAALALDDSGGYQETGSMLEAAAFTALSTTAFKLAAGRLRPNETTQVDDWRQGGDSFPSMHTSLTFAIGTVLAESGNDEYRWIRRTLGYGLSVAVGYARVHDNVHWTSDVVAGAALGFATGQFVLNRREHSPDRSSFMLMPVPGGVMVAYTRAMR